MANMQKSCCINYTAAEFEKVFGFKTGSFDYNIKKFCDLYRIDRNIFKFNSSYSNKSGNYEIQYETAPLLAMLMRMSLRHPLLSAKSTVSLSKIREHNLNVMKEIESFPDYLKNTIKAQATYWQIYESTQALPVFIKQFVMLFAVITTFSSELANNMVDDITNQLACWIDNFYEHHFQMEVSKYKCKEAPTEPHIYNISDNPGLWHGGNPSLYLLDEALLRGFRINYRQETNSISEECGKLYYELESLAGEYVSDGDCDQFRERYKKLLNGIFVETIKGRQWCIDNSINSRLPSIRQYSPEDVAQWKKKITDEYSKEYSGKELENIVNFCCKTMTDMMKQKETLFNSLESDPKYSRMLKLIDFAIGQHLISLMNREQQKMNIAPNSEQKYF